VSSICLLLTKDEVGSFIFLENCTLTRSDLWEHDSSFCVLLQLVATLQGCSAAICDKIKPSAEGAIQAIIEFVMKRGKELSETDVSRSVI